MELGKSIYNCEIDDQSLFLIKKLFLVESYSLCKNTYHLYFCLWIKDKTMFFAPYASTVLSKTLGSV